MKELTYQNFSQEIASEKLVLVEFYSPNCTHCRNMEIGLAELEQQQADKAVVAKCNIAQETALTAQYDITSVPTMLIFKNGQMIDKRIGFTHKAVLEEYIKNH